MSDYIPRRAFITIAGGALLAPPYIAAQQREQSDETPLVDQVPPMLDHILLGCNDLQRAIDFVERHTGVRAAFGGVHPGRGTQNALLSLSPSTPQQKGRYLEIMAPDPKQNSVQPFAAQLLDHLKRLESPALVGWAAHLSGNVQDFAAKLKAAGIEFAGPWPGSRQRSDGKTLHWQTLSLKDDASGLLPFFIDWDEKTIADSLHPSTDSPFGCQLLRFELLTPDPAALAKTASVLRLAAPIAKGPSPQLHAVITGPKGKLDVTS